MKGKIQAIYPEGRSSVYNYICEGEDGMFTLGVEFRYHMDIIENEGVPIGRYIEFRDDIDPPFIKFLNNEEVF